MSFAMSPHMSNSRCGSGSRNVGIWSPKSVYKAMMPVRTYAVKQNNWLLDQFISNTQMQEERNATTSRRRTLKNLGIWTGLALVGEWTSVTSGFIDAEASPLPGFKKDLKPRRIEIPEDKYQEGPEGLKYYDIKEGDGMEANQGQRVAVHYDVKWRGITFATTRQGMGVGGGSPFGFDVGAKPGQGGTLKGLDLGVRGMKVGGQRRLLVPPELAYGSTGRGEIPPNATITIDIALLSIKKDPVGYRVKLVEG